MAKRKNPGLLFQNKKDNKLKKEDSNAVKSKAEFEPSLVTKSDVEEEGDNFWCVKCEMGFKTAREMKDHLTRKKHIENVGYEYNTACNKCHKIFGNQWSLKKHLKSATHKRGGRSKAKQQRYYLRTPVNKSQTLERNEKAGGKKKGGILIDLRPEKKIIFQKPKKLKITTRRKRR